MQKITPFLWYNDDAEDAARFYTAIFKNSKIVSINKGPDGKVFSVIFNLEGQEFFALNGGPKFKFTEAVSFFVKCNNQSEVDYFWDKLSAGGRTDQCGWLKDRFGLSWQIVPDALGKMLMDPDKEKSQRVMNAMLKMNKINIAGLQAAYDGK